jgi:hypothetical protein
MTTQTGIRAPGRRSGASPCTRAVRGKGPGHVRDQGLWVVPPGTRTQNLRIKSPLPHVQPMTASTVDLRLVPWPLHLVLSLLRRYRPVARQTRAPESRSCRASLGGGQPPGKGADLSGKNFASGARGWRHHRPASPRSLEAARDSSRRRGPGQRLLASSSPGLSWSAMVSTTWKLRSSCTSTWLPSSRVTSTS